MFVVGRNLEILKAEEVLLLTFLFTCYHDYSVCTLRVTSKNKCFLLVM